MKLLGKLELLLLIFSVQIFSFTCIGQSQPSMESFEIISVLQNSSMSKTFTNLHWRKGSIIDSADHGNLKFTISGSEVQIYYIPKAGFIGKDSVSIEFIDLFRKFKYLNLIFDVQRSIIELRPDVYVISVNSPPMEISPLRNDSSSLGSNSHLKISSVNATNNVSVTLQSDSALTFYPVLDYEGYAYINYTVRDTLGSVASGNIVIQCVIPNKSEDKFFNLSTIKGKSILIPFKTTGYIILNSPKKGKLIFLQDNIMEYRPVSTATGKDTFILSNHQSKLICFIDILSTSVQSKTIRDDNYFTALNSEIRFDVSNNDINKQGTYLIAGNPDKGRLTQLNYSGEFLYKPEADFEGSQIFTYKKCRNGQCETAIVTIHISDFEPELFDQYNFRTPKNVPLLLSYLVPLDSFSFYSTNDSLKFYPNEQNVHLNYKGCLDTVSGKNVLIYYPPRDFVGIIKFKIEYCLLTNGNCYERNVEIEIFEESKNCLKQCAGDCVWPGDVNADGVVNMLDLLQLGKYMGFAGPRRIYDSGSEFRAKRSESWSQEMGEREVNLKHADTDGNGIIDIADTLSISNFYNRQHSLLPKPSITEINFPIDLNVLTPSVDSGDLAVIEILMGNELQKLSNICGYSYQLDYDVNVAFPQSLSLKHYDNSWIRHNSATVNMYKKPWDGRLESSTIRVNGNTISGAGPIEFLSFLVNGNINLFRRSNVNLAIPIVIRNFTIMSESGQLFKRPDTTIYITFDKNIHAISDSQLLVYPNPAKEYINILSNELILCLEFYTIDGRLVKAFPNVQKSFQEIYAGDIKSGVYIIKAKFRNYNKFAKVHIVN